jgi:hypothetical protein
MRYLNKRRNTYTLSEVNKEKEEDVIEAILQNNSYLTNSGPSYGKSITSMNKTVHDKNRKYVTFTYHDPEVRMITKLFRNTQLKIASKTKNTLRSHLQTKTRAINKYELSGVYQ